LLGLSQFTSDCLEHHALLDPFGGLVIHLQAQELFLLGFRYGCLVIEFSGALLILLECFFFLGFEGFWSTFSTSNGKKLGLLLFLQFSSSLFEHLSLVFCLLFLSSLLLLLLSVALLDGTSL